MPDLRAHLDELLRARERGQAMGANDWALVPMEEITRLRGLIRSLEADLATLPEQDRLKGKIRPGLNAKPIRADRRRRHSAPTD